MSKELTQAQLKELYLPSADDFVFVDVPDMQFAMIDGRGDPGGETHRLAIRWLFSAIYPLKRIAKQRMGRRFVEPPLEGLWWADDPADFIAGNRDKLRWRMMIVTANWVDAKMFADGVAAASKKLGDAPDSLRLERMEEGRSVQIMHIGPPVKMKPTVQRLHVEFLPANNLKPNGHHHEIYLNDPSRTAPEKLKTVIRQPVCPAS